VTNIDYKILKEYLMKMLSCSAYQQDYNSADHTRELMIAGMGSHVSFNSEQESQSISFLVGNQAPSKTLYIYDEGFDALQNLISHVAGDADINGKVSLETIENHVKDFFVLLKENAQKLDDDHKSLKTLLKGIRKSIHTWIAFVPVDNLFIDPAKQLNVGGITMRSANAAVERLQNLNQSKNEDGTPSDYGMFIVEMIAGQFGKSCVCEVPVTCDQNLIRLVAESRVEELLNLLRCYTNEMFGSHTRAFIGLKGDYAVSASRGVVGFQRDNPCEFTMQLENLGAFLPYSLNNARIDELSKDQTFQRLGEIIASQERSQLDGALLTAVRWLGRASIETRVPEKLLGAAIALEVLILDSNSTDNIQDRLARRLAFLLEISLESRKSLKKEVKRLYGLRSKIAHEGNCHPTTDDAAAMEQLCFRALRVMTSHSPEWKTKKDFIDWAEDHELT